VPQLRFDQRLLVTQAQDRPAPAATSFWSRARGLTSDIRAWIAICGLLGLGLVASTELLIRQPNLPDFERAGLIPAFWTGLACCGVAALALLARRSIQTNVFGDIGGPAIARVVGHPYLTLFIASFVGLYFEVAFIRYAGSQFRIFSFYRNVPLIAAYLGLGLGYWLGNGRSRQVTSFLAWLVPLAVFLSVGSIPLGQVLGTWAAFASSEHILGDVVVNAASAQKVWINQILVGAFCCVAFTSVAALFVSLGRLLGAAFEQVPRLAGYTINVLGSLFGAVLFIAMSYFELAPWCWFVVGLAPLGWWLAGRRQIAWAAVAFALSVGTTAIHYGDTVWSRYQKLIGHSLQLPGADGAVRSGYLVEISDVFYQVAFDLRPETVGPAGSSEAAVYDNMFRRVPGAERVVVVGAGTGNDVAAALRAGIQHVEAIDIDPAIVEMGRQHHPEQPYSDLRVAVRYDDARAAFRKLPAHSYDAVVFGLLDSHTLLSMSSVRLDNYVFTRESFEAARELLRPGGYLVVTAAVFRDWFGERLHQLVGTACGSEVSVERFGVWRNYTCQIAVVGSAPASAFAADVNGPTDDWPYLYLPARSIPQAYLVVIGLLVLASIGLVRWCGVRLRGSGALQSHFFFLGAAFLLVEVYAVNRLALFFGSTWLVSAIAIAAVLALIVAANLSAAYLGGRDLSWAYIGVFACLALSYALNPSAALGSQPGAMIAIGLGVLSPVYFAGLVFAGSFRSAANAGVALGANLFGAAVGGWIEYLSMAFGVRALAIIAASIYLLSLAALLWHRRLSPDRHSA